LGIDFNKLWCVYVTTHAKHHFFYKGKGKTQTVVDGDYSGSGVALKNAMATICDDGWDTWVYSTHDTENEAYKAEANFIDFDDRKNPWCLNIRKGGGSAQYTKSQEMTPERVAQIKAAYMLGV
jgi:hypothetical protein